MQSLAWCLAQKQHLGNVEPPNAIFPGGPSTFLLAELCNTAFICSFIYSFILQTAKVSGSEQSGTPHAQEVETPSHLCDLGEVT